MFQSLYQRTQHWRSTSLRDCGWLVVLLRVFGIQCSSCVADVHLKKILNFFYLLLWLDVAKKNNNTPNIEMRLMLMLRLGLVLLYTVHKQVPVPGEMVSLVRVCCCWWRWERITAGWWRHRLRLTVKDFFWSRFNCEDEMKVDLKTDSSSPILNIHTYIWSNFFIALSTSRESGSDCAMVRGRGDTHTSERHF